MLWPVPLMAPNAAPIKSLAKGKSDVGPNRNLWARSGRISLLTFSNALNVNKYCQMNNFKNITLKLKIALF